LTLAGWIANHIDPNMTNTRENVESLRARLRAPLLGCVPYCEPTNASLAADALDVDTLLAGARSS
jgi:dethiobiotin synthetase